MAIELEQESTIDVTVTTPGMPPVTATLKHEVRPLIAPDAPRESTYCGLTLKFCQQGLFSTAEFRFGFTSAAPMNDPEARAAIMHDDRRLLEHELRQYTRFINMVRTSLGQMGEWSLDPQPQMQLPEILLPLNTLG